ncbi:hypothetical protein [Gilliamella sp. Pas-s25]|uniref:hypothetical protein n=1 Tax=Gilliamella sp. Pas-s25 TaxID=2687310 RepID=UPI00135ED579|nr:hypothetical protein [Gilliamella sp. Pas-s25]MWP61959.1 hypothetical protein [Gilliamella sp. Pas-s25]
MKKHFIIILVLFLTACDNSENIKKVKALIYSQLDKTITVGNALDNRELCKKVNWESLKDEKQRDIVEYSCNLDTKKAENFLHTQLDDELNTLKSKFVETDIKVSPEEYKKFRIDEVKASQNKRYKYTIYGNYVDINAQAFIYANAKLEAYNLLGQALDDISKSKAFIRYQQNRNYFIANKENIEKVILEDHSIDNPKETIEYIYSSTHSSLIGDIFWIDSDTSPSQFFKWQSISNQTIRNRIEEMFIDIEDIHNQLKEHKIYFSHSYLFDQGGLRDPFHDKEIRYNDKLLKIDQDGMINLAHSSDCCQTFRYFLEGETPKIVSIYDDKIETKISANNYRELLASLKTTQKNIISKMVSDVLVPHNNANKSNIEIVQKLQNDLKIKSYDQKIRWSLVGEQEPVLTSCELIIETNSFPKVISDPKLANHCFSATYSDRYIESVYNDPLYQILNNINSSLKN